MVLEKDKNFGVCIGMQIMADKSEEGNSNSMDIRQCKKITL